MFIGTGTVVNAATVLLGSSAGVLLGHRLPDRTRTVITDGLGLVTLLIAAGSALAVRDRDLTAAVGPAAPTLIVLGAVVLGGVLGSLLGLQDRLEGLAGRFHGSRDGFVPGFVVSSLVFCVGPLTVIGSISEGIGHGPDQLLLKAALDGFTAIGFAASLGWGVAASAVTVLLVQGALTALGAALGDFLPAAHLSALTATGGLLLVAVGLRLLEIKDVKVADLVPALVVAPLLTELAIRLH